VPLGLSVCLSVRPSGALGSRDPVRTGPFTAAMCRAEGRARDKALLREHFEQLSGSSGSEEDDDGDDGEGADEAAGGRRGAARRRVLLGAKDDAAAAAFRDRQSLDSLQSVPLGERASASGAAKPRERCVCVWESRSTATFSLAVVALQCI
jgi:hypothetical protein